MYMYLKIIRTGFLELQGQVDGSVYGYSQAMDVQLTAAVLCVQGRGRGGGGGDDKL